MSKVLVVDDDPVIRVLIEEFLASHGHQVTVTDSGTGCLEHLEGNSPDFILLDLQMPDMTGFEVLKEIRCNQKTISIPVVLLSANDERGTIHDATQEEGTQFLQKPFNMQDILKVLGSD